MRSRTCHFIYLGAKEEEAKEAKEALENALEGDALFGRARPRLVLSISLSLFFLLLATHYEKMERERERN